MLAGNVFCACFSNQIFCHFHSKMFFAFACSSFGISISGVFAVGSLQNMGMVYASPNIAPM